MGRLHLEEMESSTIAMGIISGSTFVLLSLLDILQIFPQSPTPISPLLLGFEVTILILSVVAVVSSYRVLIYGTVGELTVLRILVVIRTSLAIFGK